MALKLFPIPFPIFAPSLNPQPYPAPNPNPESKPPTARPPTEVRFSRWNNANAEEFNERRRAQKEIEDDIRRHRRFSAVARITNTYSPAPPKPITTTTTQTYRSAGTPSTPSSPSIPGRKSKYSKDATDNHPAFRSIQSLKKVSHTRRTQIEKDNVKMEADSKLNTKADIKLSEEGLTYVIDGAPFEFRYSYTESPKVKPLKLREAAYTPFGPTTMARPWTGRAPLPPSKKQLRQFDSFKLPPPHKKGVKPVQSPGPFLAGSGPKYVRSREQILGEKLTEEEITSLVEGCMKSKRQLNMGRDGFTHNMLDNIHAHWKRKRVCKIRCKGVCTVDMNNVCQQLEEKTGGKVIYRKGGILYLFRGRNYNWKTRPRYPLMLWKPITPVYPRLVQLIPEGLTLEEATELRKKGHKMIPICKLGKNGVYCNLVQNVREAFEECELVRINCEGMNPSDYRKIGAKLKDLVPCVLMSFQYEHLLMWRGKNWKSIFPAIEIDNKEDNGSEVNNAASITTSSEVEESLESCSQVLEFQDEGTNQINTRKSPVGGSVSRRDHLADSEEDAPDKTSEEDSTNSTLEDVQDLQKYETTLSEKGCTDGESASVLPDTIQEDETKMLQDQSELEKQSFPCTEGILKLWKEALESGRAAVLTGVSLDADIVYRKAFVFARSAPPEPIFERRPRKIALGTGDEKESTNTKMMKYTRAPEKVATEKKTLKIETGFERESERTSVFDGQYLDIVPQGCLAVDELAKLLA